MSDLNNARRRFKITQSKKQDTATPIPALLGRGNGTVVVPNQAGQVYIRVGNQENYGTAYNDRVPNTDDLPVFVGYDPVTDPDRRLFQVLTIRQSAYVDAGNPPIPQVGPHHDTHEYGGGDDTYIQWRRLMGLRVGRPALFVVTVDPGYIYRITTWIAAPVGVSTVDLTAQHAALAGNQAQYVLISLDSTGTISVLPAGIIKASPALLLPSDIPTPPVGNIPLAAVRIYGSQTAIGDSPATPDIIDLRFPTYANMGPQAPALTATYIGYGDVGGLLTGSSALTWNGQAITISHTAPSLVLTDTTASAKSLTHIVDANFAHWYESAGAAGDILTLNLVNKRVGIKTSAPLSWLSVGGVGIANCGVYGTSPGGGIGVYGEGQAGSVGVYGIASGAAGIWGTSTNSYGVYGNGSPGGYFKGAVAGHYALITGAGNVGFNIAAPLAQVHIESTTEQLRVGYDGSNYFKTTVASNGATTLATLPVGAGFVFTPPVTFNAAITATAVVNPLTTAAESWIGPSSTVGIYFKGGYIGVGSPTPLTKLQVAGLIYSSNSESDATGFASWADNNSKYNFMGSGGYWGIRSSTAHSFNLDVYNVGSPITAVTVLQNGNVGIGTTSPTAKLHVVGLADYANNAAAVAAGLTTGAFYTETGTNPKRVCVVT